MIRPITIRSRYFDAECESCGAKITLDSGPEGYDGDPIEITTADDHEDDCPQAPSKPVLEPLSIQVHASDSRSGQFVAFLYPNAETPDWHLNIGLVYGKTRHEAASLMLGCLEQMGYLNGRTIPVVFQEG